MKQNNIGLLLVVAVVVGGAGFFGGMKYQQSQSPQRQFGLGNAQGGARGQGGAGRQGFRPIAGQIVSADAQSVTVKLSDGSTKIALLTSKTQIDQATAATVSDLKAGAPVSVFGTTNSDGSVTAQSVQLNPRMDRGGPTPTQSPTP